MYYVLFTLASITAAGVVNGDFSGFVPRTAALFVASCCLCFAGVGLITTQKNGSVKDGFVQLTEVDETLPIVSVLTTPRLGTTRVGSLSSKPSRQLQEFEA